MIDRSTLPPADAAYMDLLAQVASERRARNKRLGRCINDSTVSTHAGPVSGRVRCARCIAVHKYGAASVSRGARP